MRRMGIGLGVGINRSNYAQGIFGAYATRVVADGGVVEAGACVDAVSGLLLSASLLLIPSGYKSTKLYSEIPTNGNGDLTWTRASTAIRTNSSGLLESMGSGVPRLSYMYGSCPALLLEPQRTNLVLQSETFDNAYWTKASVFVTANATTSPEGTNTADLIVENSSNSGHAISRGLLGLGSGTYTCTIYAKAKERNKILLFGGGATLAGYGFDLVNGTANAVTGITAPSSFSIENVGNGWYRCSITITTTTFSFFEVYLLSSFSGFSYQGDGTSGLYIYGAQLEQGAYPTTYISTTSATATRVADSFSRNNIYTNGLITASGGTWFVELRGNVAMTRDASINSLFIADTNLGSTNGFVFRNQGAANSRLFLAKRVAGAETTIYQTTTDTAKIAIKWNGTSCDVFANGTKVTSASSFTTTLMEFLIGNGNDVPKFIQQMALYPEPLTDTKLIELTTL